MSDEQKVFDFIEAIPVESWLYEPFKRCYFFPIGSVAQDLRAGGKLQEAITSQVIILHRDCTEISLVSKMFVVSDAQNMEEIIRGMITFASYPFDKSGIGFSHFRFSELEDKYFALLKNIKHNINNKFPIKYLSTTEVDDTQNVIDVDKALDDLKNGNPLADPSIKNGAYGGNPIGFYGNLDI